jgi:hypothetical protein
MISGLWLVVADCDANRFKYNENGWNIKLSVYFT